MLVKRHPVHIHEKGRPDTRRCLPGAKTVRQVRLNQQWHNAAWSKASQGKESPKTCHSKLWRWTRTMQEKKTAASEGSNTLRDELCEHWKWTGQWAGSGQKCKKEKLTVTWQLLRSCGKGPILTPKKLGAENSKLGINQWSLFHCFFCLWSVYKIQMAYWQWIYKWTDGYVSGRGGLKSILVFWCLWIYEWYTSNPIEH